MSLHLKYPTRSQFFAIFEKWHRLRCKRTQYTKVFFTALWKEVATQVELRAADEKTLKRRGPFTQVVMADITEDQTSNRSLAAGVLEVTVQIDYKDSTLISQFRVNCTLDGKTKVKAWNQLHRANSIYGDKFTFWVPKPAVKPQLIPMVF